MTDSIDEKTPRHPRLTPQHEEFDFDLADVQPISAHRDPSPVAHFDEPVAVVELDHQSAPVFDAPEEQQPRQQEARGFNTTESLTPNTQTVSEIKTNFYVDYFDKRKKNKAAPLVSPEPAQTAVDSMEVLAVDPVEEHQAQHEAFYFEENQTDNKPVVEDDNAPVIDGAGMAVAVLSQFKSKQESINKQQEKLIQDFRKKITNTTRLTYTAAFFGIASLVAATTFGVMLLKNNADISDLAGTTTALKDDIRNIKTMPNELEGTDPSLDQLNRKVDDVAGRLDQVTTLQNKVASLEKALQAKQQAALIAAAKQPNPVLSPAVTEVAPIEPIAKPAATKTTKPVKNNGAEQVVATAATPVPATKPSVPANKKAPENTLPANDINNLVTAQVPVAAVNNPAAANDKASASVSGWTVNLASSNQLADAKRTAESYAQKGVPVTITPITVKNETRYRIQVKGFKSKDEAAAYAAKAKDALKLNSVWINP
jgi:hypothetical protein